MTSVPAAIRPDQGFASLLESEPDRPTFHANKLREMADALLAQA